VLTRLSTYLVKRFGSCSSLVELALSAVCPASNLHHRRGFVAPCSTCVELASSLGAVGW